MKELRILRGLPGSGKSYLANQMKVEEGAVVFNNDEFMTDTDDIFTWSEDGAVEAHVTNQKRIVEAMRLNVPLLVLDAINTVPYHCCPHVRLAKYYGYDFHWLHCWR